MSLLATDSRVAVDRVYPFENRYFTYLANLAVLLDRQDATTRMSEKQLYDFENSEFGASPWDSDATLANDNAPLLGFPSRREFLPKLWHTFSARVARNVPGAVFYAEKVPSWLPSLARECLCPFTISLFRDPRDVFLSANAFMRKDNPYDLGRSRGDTDLDYARTLTHEYLNYFENYFMDRHRKDCMLVRYEEIVLCKEDLPARLAQHLSLKSSWDAAIAWPEKHQTAEDLAFSVNRWQREPLPEDVASFFDKHLCFEMAHLEYPTTAVSPDSLPRLEFRRGAIDLARLAQSGDGQLAMQEEAANVTITGHDFWMELPLEPFHAAAVCEIWVSLKAAVGEVCSIYWHGDAEGFSEERCCHLHYWPAAHWRVFRFKVSNHPLWKGMIACLRLDLFNGGDPAKAGNGAIRWLRLVE